MIKLFFNQGSNPGKYFNIRILNDYIRILNNCSPHMLCSVFFVYVFINTFIHKRLLKTKKPIAGGV